MANICFYTIKVKGKKSACYALLYSMPSYCYDKKILGISGNDDDFSLTFNGDCKWWIDWNKHPLENPQPLSEEQLKNTIDWDYYQTTMLDKSILFDCDIYIEATELDQYITEPESQYAHYSKGTEILDDFDKGLCADFLYKFDTEVNVYLKDLDWYVEPTVLVEFKDQTIWCKNSGEIGDVVGFQNKFGIIRKTSRSDVNPGLKTCTMCIGNINDTEVARTILTNEGIEF